MTSPPDRGDPFAPTVDPERWVPWQAGERALQELERAVLEGSGVVCLRGPAGSGRTSLLSQLARRLQGRLSAVHLPYGALEPPELARVALGLLGVDAGRDPEAQLLATSWMLRRRGSGLLLLVDDADAMPLETGRRLRAMAETSEGSLRPVVVLGRERNLAPLIEALHPVEVALAAGLRREETEQILRCRLEDAGAPPDLAARFDGATVDALHRLSEGNPRRLEAAAAAFLRTGRLPGSGREPEEAEARAREARAAVAPGAASTRSGVEAGDTGASTERGADGRNEPEQRAAGGTGAGGTEQQAPGESRESHASAATGRHGEAAEPAPTVTARAGDGAGGTVGSAAEARPDGGGEVGEQIPIPAPVAGPAPEPRPTPCPDSAAAEPPGEDAAATARERADAVVHAAPGAEGPAEASVEAAPPGDEPVETFDAAAPGARRPGDSPRQGRADAGAPAGSGLAAGADAGERSEAPDRGVPGAGSGIDDASGPTEASEARAGHPVNAEANVEQPAPPLRDAAPGAEGPGRAEEVGTPAGADTPPSRDLPPRDVTGHPASEDGGAAPAPVSEARPAERERASAGEPSPAAPAGGPPRAVDAPSGRVGRSGPATGSRAADEVAEAEATPAREDRPARPAVLPAASPEAVDPAQGSAAREPAPRRTGSGEKPARDAAPSAARADAPSSAVPAGRTAATPGRAAGAAGPGGPTAPAEARQPRRRPEPTLRRPPPRRLEPMPPLWQLAGGLAAVLLAAVAVPVIPELGSGDSPLGLGAVRDRVAALLRSEEAPPAAPARSPGSGAGAGPDREARAAVTAEEGEAAPSRTPRPGDGGLEASEPGDRPTRRVEVAEARPFPHGAVPGEPTTSVPRVAPPGAAGGVPGEPAPSASRAKVPGADVPGTTARAHHETGGPPEAAGSRTSGPGERVETARGPAPLASSRRAAAGAAPDSGIAEHPRTGGEQRARDALGEPAFSTASSDALPSSKPEPDAGPAVPEPESPAAAATSARPTPDRRAGVEAEPAAEDATPAVPAPATEALPVAGAPEPSGSEPGTARVPRERPGDSSPETPQEHAFAARPAGSPPEELDEGTLTAEVGIAEAPPLPEPGPARTPAPHGGSAPGGTSPPDAGSLRVARAEPVPPAPVPPSSPSEPGAEADSPKPAGAGEVTAARNPVRGPGAPSGADAEVEAPQPPRPVAVAVAPEPAPPPEPVLIAINAIPWAVIEIDGEEVGETPLARIPLPPGRHRFIARFPDGRVVARDAEVDSDNRRFVFE